MANLSKREIEMVALGAALGSNCIQCVHYHVRAAKQLGVTDQEFDDVFKVADQVRKVPAKKVLESAYASVQSKAAAHEKPAAENRGCGCDA